ncbi:MAG: N-acetylneuraminate synthase [Bdellovibrionota bacterium]
MKKRPTFIIAEAGVNHNGSEDLAIQLIDAAAEAGADAVKFQTFKSAALVSKSAKQAEYQTKNTGVAESQFEMLKRLELAPSVYRNLLKYARAKGIGFLSTPFDVESADFLTNDLHLDLLKIGSGDITNAPLLLSVAHTGKPVILSTGMSSLSEIETALGVIAFGYLKIQRKPSLAAFQEAFHSQTGKEALAAKVTLLHCVSEYPADWSEANLKAISTLRDVFGLSTGYSDHTMGLSAPVAAVALGATVIEKHFTLDKRLPGPDHLCSLEPHELKLMVQMIRQVEASLGTGEKQASRSEEKNKPVVRRSLVAATAIRKGEVFSEKNLTSKRPGDGVSPVFYWDWLGKIAERDFKEDEQIS